MEDIDESKDDRRKRLANERQKRYYKKNAPQICEKFQVKRDRLAVFEINVGDMLITQLGKLIYNGEPQHQEHIDENNNNDYQPDDNHQEEEEQHNDAPQQPDVEPEDEPEEPIVMRPVKEKKKNNANYVPTGGKAGRPAKSPEAQALRDEVVRKAQENKKRREEMEQLQEEVEGEKVAPRRSGRPSKKVIRQEVAVVKELRKKKVGRKLSLLCGNCEYRNPCPLHDHFKPFTRDYMKQRVEYYTKKELVPNTVSTMETLFQISKCNSFEVGFKSPDEFVKKLDVARWGSQNQLYEITSKKNLFQHIVKAIDHTPNLKEVLTEEIFEEYVRLFQISKIEVSEQYAKRIVDDDEAVMRFTEIRELVNNVYPLDSEHRLIINLYYELTARDDFKNLVVVNTTDDATDPNTNYIVIPVPCKNKKLFKISTIVLNSYKTDGGDVAYKKRTMKVNLSGELSKSISRFLLSKSEDQRDELFQGVRKPSTLLSEIKAKLNMKSLTINVLRHSKTTELYYNKPTAKERNDLAVSMMHSPDTQVKYVKRLLKRRTDPLIQSTELENM